MQKLKKILRINKYALLAISALMISSSSYMKINYKYSFEQLLYTVQNLHGTGVVSIRGGIYNSLLNAFLIFIVIMIPIVTINLKYKVYLELQIKNVKKIITISYVEHRLIYSIIVFICAILISLYNFGFFYYLKNQFQYSKIYETYFVDPNSILLSFPKKKQNLIYIYVESLETTMASKENGGNQNKSYIPNLEKLALNNTSFSNTSNLGGALQVEGVGWTVAGMIAQTSGINMKVNINGNDYHGYSSFLGGVTNLGDILKNNGYKNYIMMGSDAKFGGRDELFLQHGDYEIYDYIAAKEEKDIPENYEVWWGYEDKKLFEFAKKKLLNISKNKEPFNLTLLTADTHFQDGYLDKICPKKFKNHYANSFYCSDSMIGSFVNWIKKQSFYNNTTIIIVGDHLTMQNNFCDDCGDYERTVYNTIINSRSKTTNTKNRKFSTIDMFPTTLSALGVKIEGNRLGLGTNLFSDKETLIEQLGYNRFNEELAKKSIYYNNNLLEKSYYEMEYNTKINNPE